jgi:Tfp pilus assembly PilM family ATPase
MSQNLSRVIAVIGIDIGKNSFHVVGLMNAVQSCCVKSGHVAKLKDGSSICRRA